MAFVLDASAALPWCFSDDVTPFTEALLRRAMDGEGIFVQAHWPTEILSALLQGKRRGRIGSTGIQRFLVNLSSLRIVVEESFVVMRMEELLKLSDLHEVTA